MERFLALQLVQKVSKCVRQWLVRYTLPHAAQRSLNFTHHLLRPWPRPEWDDVAFGAVPVVMIHGLGPFLPQANGFRQGLFRS